MQVIFQSNLDMQKYDLIKFCLQSSNISWAKLLQREGCKCKLPPRSGKLQYSSLKYSRWPLFTKQFDPQQYEKG